jgi:hypothetical protein
MATRNIGKLAAQLVANDDGFVKVLERVDRGLTNLEKKGRKTNASLSNAFSVGAVIGVTIQAIDMLGSRMTGVVSKVTQGLEEMNRTAEDAAILGLGVGEIQEVVGAFKLANVEADTTRKIVEDLIRTMANARAGEDSAVAQLERIGIAADDLRGLNTREILSRVADGLADIESPAEKAAAAYELFGRQAHNVLRVLGDGSSGLTAAIVEARQVGGIIDDVAIERAVRFDQALDRATLAAEGMAKRLGAKVAPALEKTLDAFTALNVIVNKLGVSGSFGMLTGRFKDAARESQVLQVALTALGGAAAAVDVSGKLASMDVEAVEAAQKRANELKRIRRSETLLFKDEIDARQTSVDFVDQEAEKRRKMMDEQIDRAKVFSDLWRNNLENLGSTLDEQINTSLSKLTGLDLSGAQPILRADLIEGGSAEAQRIARMPQGPQDNPTLKAAQQTAENTAAIARNTVPSGGVVNYFLP